MRSNIRIRKVPPIVDSFRIWILVNKTPKYIRFAMEIQKRELPLVVDSFPIWILVGKTPKNMHFTMEHPNTDYVFNLKNTKKHAFCKGSSECLDFSW